MVDSIDIVKGPAAVQGGAGAGVGGSIDITTKVPSSTNFSAIFNAEGDTQQKRIVGFDVGGPLTSNIAGRLAVTSNDSGSYYYDMFFHQQQVFAALVDQVTSKYTISFNGSYVDTQYRENDGINRVNQALIDDGTTSPARHPERCVGLRNRGFLTGSTHLNSRTIIDESVGNGAHSSTPCCR